MKTMNKFKIGVLFSVMLLIIVLAACGETNGDKENSTELTYNTWMDSTYYIVEEYVNPWVEEVEERTDGQIKFNMNYGGVLGEADSHYDDINSGRYDATLGFPTYLNNDDLYPLTISELPFAITDPIKGQAVVEKFWENYGDEAYGEDVLTGTPSQTSAYYIHSSKPIESYEDLKGMKVGSIDDTWEPVTKEWGATPMLLSIPDIYTNLDRGIIDAVIYSDKGSLGLSLSEVAPYVVDHPMNALMQLPLTKKSALDGLDEDLKQTYEEDLLPLQADIYLDFYEQDSIDTWDEIEKVISDAGGEVIELPDEDIEKLEKSGEVAWDNWAEEANERGLDGDKMMEDFREMMEEEGLDLPY